MSFCKRIAVVAVLLLLAGMATAADYEREITYLLDAVGNSDCSFIRNGRSHSATEAEQHLRMKYRKGSRYVDSAEQFVDRIASRSSWSGQPYKIQCPGEDARPAADWLLQRLQSGRTEGFE